MGSVEDVRVLLEESSHAWVGGLAHRVDLTSSLVATLNVVIVVNCFVEDHALNDTIGDVVSSWVVRNDELAFIEGSAVRAGGWCPPGKEVHAAVVVVRWVNIYELDCMRVGAHHVEVNVTAVGFI